MISTHNKLLLVFLSAVIVVGCSGRSLSLKAEEQSLIQELNYDPDLLLQVKALGGSFERLPESTPHHGPGADSVIVFVARDSKVENLLGRVRALLQGTDYNAYLVSIFRDEVAILQNTDQYEYLDIVSTDGINFGLTHEDVMAQYRDWEDAYGLSLIGAEFDWLEAELEDPPDDWKLFAEEVYEFAPDVVEQGTGDIDSLAEYMRGTNTVFLWWD